MKKKFLLALLLASVLSGCGSEETPEVTEQPSGLTEVSIESMVNKRVVDDSSSTLKLPDDHKVPMDVVAGQGDADLAEWLNLYNDQMVMESAIGTWVPAYINVFSEYYVYDDETSADMPDISLQLSHDGMLYTIGDESVDEPVSCSLAGYSIESDTGNVKFTITSYGCLEYTCEGYSIVLVKE